MEVFYINHLSDLPKLETNSCAIGNFDGLHQGHRKLIENSFVAGYKRLVITFEKLDNKNGYLTKTNQRIKLIEEMGVDYLIILPFRIIKNVFFNEFIVMLKQLKVKFISCGIDFRFGYKREGDIIDLKKNFKINVLDDYLKNGVRISTSLIKDFIADGMIEEANELLTTPYTIIGEVIHGNKIGRKLGFATANIDYDEYILPKNGVYFTIATVRGTRYLSMTNIGYNPTLNQQEAKRLEVHILDFEDDIYGEEIEVEFIKYLREERQFESKEELISSLEETINICRNYEHMIK